jgi:LPXTG-site transpeptidase (sortase) family protein
MKRFLRYFRRFLFVCAISLLTYCGYVLIDSWMFQRAASYQFQQSLTLPNELAPHKPAPAAPAGLIGRIEIPRLGVSVIVIEGTSRTILGRAAGHIAGTALPGQQGNIGISAHRDTFFRPLRNIRPNDTITLTTLAGEYRYHVVSTQIVSPSDVGVLKSGDDQTLTLVTCYPFYFVGPAPNRFIVRAALSLFLPDEERRLSENLAVPRVSR